MSTEAVRISIIVASAMALFIAGFYILLPRIIQGMIRLALWPRYGFEIVGQENVPKTGPVLFAANHQSWLDGFIVSSLSPRRGHALVNANLVNRPVFKQFSLRAGIIPIPYSGPRAILSALHHTRDVLDLGKAVAIFPEGQISRTGLMQPFQRGIELMLKNKPDVTVIPFAIDNVWGSFFSFSGGHYFGKRPKGLRRTINIVFGPPLKHPWTAFTIRQAVLETLVHAYELRPEPTIPLETLDPSLPRWEHPQLGLLTASTQSVIFPEIDVRQIGHKDSTVGHSVPGVAIRVVNEEGTPLPPDTEGRIEALVAHREGWIDTGRRGNMDGDGFVKIVDIS
jgi:1-acyl-sn-glycerol-3-phosphate acyltransferase